MTINAGEIEYSVGINTTEMEKGAQKVEQSVNKIDTQMNKVAASTKKASGALGMMSRNAGQAGIQIQQFVGQIQGGQSAMLALSQQAADLGIVLGAPLVGAVIGLSASFAGMLLPSLLETENALEKYNEKQKESQEATNEFIKSTDAASKNNAILTATTKLNREYDLLSQTINNAKEEQKKITEQIGTASETAVSRLIARFESLNEVIKESEEKQKTLSAQIEETFNQGLQEATDQTDEAARSLQSFTDALQTKVETLGMTERGLALYTAEQLGATQADKDSINAKYDIIEAYQQQIISQKELNKEIDDYAKLGEKLIKDEERRKESLANRGATIGLTDEEAFRLQLENQDAILKEMLEARLITEQEYIERRNNLYAEGNSELSNVWSALENQAIGTLASIVSGAQSGKDAIRGLASSIATQLVGALIKMGIQAAIGQTSAVASGTATAAALSSAYATPAALASLASYGANAVPAQAGIATTIATTNALAIGGREMGGPVSAGSMYRVGERGNEIFQGVSGRNYFVPGEDGQIINNKDAFGGGNPVNVVVNNNAPNTQATASQDSSGNIEVVISAISDQVMTGQGKFARALRQGTNTTFKAGV